MGGQGSCGCYTLASEIVTKFVDLSVFSSENVQEDSTDHIYEYAKEVISLGLLYMEFQDSIREGDGERVLNCWRNFDDLIQSNRA